MPSNDIAEIKSRLDIVEVVGKYVPNLRKAGRNYKANCPFHQERSPSFMVNPDLQYFKCFGCGEHGDVITFIQKIERVETGEAIRIAAEKAGYELHAQSPEAAKLEAARKRIIEANGLAAEFWHYLLTKHNAGAAGRDYAAKRQIRDVEIKKFKLGYAPAGNNLKPFLVKKGFTEQELEKFGLLVERNGEYQDKYRERLILPIYNMKGQVAGFSGRIIKPSDYAPKYLNSPETLLYKKSEILLGLYQAKDAARAANFIIMQEGNIDLLSSHKVGIENIVATGGTAVTEAHCKLLKRYADTVYFCFDTDAAGQKASIKALELAESIGLAHKTIDIGKFKDPDELISANPTAWATVIAKPQNTLQYLLDVFSKDLDLSIADDKSKLAKLMLPVLAVVRDEVQQSHFARELALRTGVTHEQILKKLGKEGTFAQVSNPKPEEEDVSRVGIKKEALKVPASQREAYFLALLTNMDNIAELDLNPDIFLDPVCREIYDLLLHHAAPRNFGKLAELLSDEGKLKLQQVLTQDLDDAAMDITMEINNAYKMLYAALLRRQLLELRRQLQQQPDNLENLQRLQQLTVELQHFER